MARQVDEDLKMISLRIPSRLADEIQTYAEKTNLSRNQLMVNLLAYGLEDLRMLNSIGLLVVGKGFRDIVEKVKRGEIKPNEQKEMDI